MKQSSGITAIELLIMLSIVAILATIGIPSFLSLLNNQRLTGASTELYHALQLARAEAIKRNTNVYLSFSPGSNWCYGINAGSACNCTTAGNCGLGATQALAANQTTLSQTGYGSNSVFFEGTHGGASASGSITLTLNSNSTYITLTITKLGNIQMCSNGISGYSSC